MFSLGAILYEMLKGRYALRGKGTKEIVDATRHVDPIPPTRFNRAVTKPVVALVGKMLQKERRRRPAGMAEVLAAVQSIRGALPAEVRVPEVACLPNARAADP